MADDLVVREWTTGWRDQMDEHAALVRAYLAVVAERDYFKEVSERHYACLQELDAPAEVRELVAELSVMKRHSLSLADELDTMKAQLAAMTAERDAERAHSWDMEKSALEALGKLTAMTAERDGLLASWSELNRHHQEAIRKMQQLSDKLAASEAALLEATAELIYLRLYGKDGAVWRANESKDVWRVKARAAARRAEGRGVMTDKWTEGHKAGFPGWRERMNKLVEKMAEAMYRAPPAPGIPWGDLSENARTGYLNEARAALAVVLAELREPSEGMCRAAARSDYPTMFANIWRAMFTAFEKENAG